MAQKKSSNKSYAQLTTELGEIIAWFESDEVELDKALLKYEQAAELIKQMEDYLKKAENKIRKINTAGKS